MMGDISKHEAMTILFSLISFIGGFYIFKKLIFKKETCQTLYDLTTMITENTIVFPGDPVFQKKQVNFIGKGCCFNLSELSMGNHMGTHIDFPAHVIPGGKTSSNYSLADLSGNGIILQLPDTTNSITGSYVRNQKISQNSFVFFKTRNSKLSKQNSLMKNFVYIEPDAAIALLEKKVRVVGIDYISVDSYDAENLPAHHLLLSNNVLIVENLELKNIAPGKCHVFIAPLNIPEMDGLPARVMMSR